LAHVRDYMADSVCSIIVITDLTMRPIMISRVCPREYCIED